MLLTRQHKAARWFTKLGTKRSLSRSSIALAATTVFIAFRAAGYLTETPVAIDDPNSVFRQTLLDTLGEPTETLEDGGMLWKNEDTVVYTNSYRAVDTNSGGTYKTRTGIHSFETTTPAHTGLAYYSGVHR